MGYVLYERRALPTAFGSGRQLKQHGQLKQQDYNSITIQTYFMTILPLAL